MQLIELFIAFFLAGLFSFGGGYAMVPLLQHEIVYRHGWMTAREFADQVGLAGIAPGPMAANIAVLTGHRVAGYAGAIVAMLGIVLPSLLLILLLGTLFFRYRDNRWVQASLYGLRPAVAGLIAYAAVSFAKSGGMLETISWFAASQLLLFAGALIALLVYRKHPVSVMIVSGLVGVALYS
ncbi:chromate transporter [Paenibacillus pasadenensis]|uniref:Chromate transport protein n=1 Tax=Paenibacillus pasadenensis TaxID=217090 RepID=A0A2N5N4M2_9BACL|nr:MULTISPECIES: chromate transporter [Paenibacillus]PLT45262.1 chromate transport protein [Paenibacillus pasadenensis]QGG55649.1 chromate transporter [Paenibacillus sp. B01]